MHNHLATRTMVHVNRPIIIRIAYRQTQIHPVRMIGCKVKVRKYIDSIFRPNIIIWINSDANNSFMWLFFLFHRRGRKRRSHRRKTPQQPTCNTSFSSMNEPTPPQPTSCPYVMDNENTTEPMSPGKKRKLSTHTDLPGPSYTRSTQPIPKDVPMSDFYHSLLESTYENDMRCMYYIERIISVTNNGSTISIIHVAYFFIFFFILQLQHSWAKRKWLKKHCNCLDWSSCKRKPCEEMGWAIYY